MSSKLYFRKSDVVQALRECADKARAEGFAAGRAEAERFLEFAARLNGSAPHVLKAIRGEELPPRKESPPADEDASPLDAATLAYIDALIEAKTHHADSDGGDVADVLRGWIEDPAALEAALGGEMLLKAFDEGKHPRDDGGRFVSKEAIHAAKSDPKKAEELRARVTDPEQRKKLDAAIGGETDLGRTKRGEQQQASEGRKAEAKKRFDRVRELKDAISAARRGGEEVPHTHFTELAEHLPHLTVSQLRSVRESLAASFFGRKRRDEMVTALVRHAKVRAEQMRAEQDAGDGLDFGMDAMSPAAAGGQGRAHDSDLNPWREFDKDKGYGEAQHGGRIGQRKQIMDAVSDGAKTSHGTPDLGSKLKQPDKMLDVRTLAPENKAGLTLDQQVKKDEPPEAPKAEPAPEPAPEPAAPQNPPKESEDVAPIAEPPAKKLGEKKTRKPSATDSLYDWTQHYGGIDPESHAFQTFFGSVNEARENGIPLGVFKKGGEGLDVIARQMLNSGHINAKDEVEAQQVLLDGLASKAYSYHADRTKDYDKALQNYERAKQEAADALNESSIREAERSGEAEADRGEPASGRGADQDSDAGDGGRQPGDAAEPIGEVDTSFDFGDSTPTSKSDAKNDAKASAQPSQKATPEQAAARKWQKNDDGTYTAPNGTVWRKAAAGGEVSPVTGQPFKGGHMMPVHGLSPKVEKPQTTGTGDAASVKPNEDAEGKRQPARSPMTPEQIEEERENRARQAKWDEMRGGVLGKLKHLTDKPMPLRNSTIDVDRWKQFADGVDEGKLKQIVDVLRKDRHDAIDADVVAQGQTNLDKDSIDWEKNSPERQSEIFPLSGKYRSKGKPSSNLARQHVQHALEDAKNPHDLHAIEKKLQGIVNAPAPSDTPVSPTQNAAPSAKPDASKTTSPAAIPPDHAAALRDAAKHHRRMQMPGKPIPAHVVYTKPATKDATGKPLDPEETVAIPADSSGGERILAGKSPHYTVHGVYEFGPDGTPRIAEPRQMAAQAKRIVHDDGATGV